MGNTCACFQNNSSNKEAGTIDLVQKGSETMKDAAFSKLSSQQEEGPISVSAKIGFQSLVRGYLNRKHIRESRRETRETEQDNSPKLLTLFLSKSLKKQANVLLSAFAIPPSFSVVVSLSMPDGTFFEGKIDDSGNRVNFGISLLPDGSLEAGVYENNALEGQGRSINADGSLYQGLFVNGVPCGHGVYIYPNGSKFEGDIQDGLPEGSGRVYYTDNSVYEGMFRKGLKDGSGRLVWPNGDCYIGEFCDDLRHGQGRMAWHNLEYYEGEWQLDSITGTGEFSYLNGDLYEGSLVNGLRHGPGSLIRSDGVVHECVWKNDKEDGEGTVIIIREEDEEVQQAMWVDGIKV